MCLNESNKVPILKRVSAVYDVYCIWQSYIMADQQSSSGLDDNSLNNGKSVAVQWFDYVTFTNNDQH